MIIQLILQLVFNGKEKLFGGTPKVIDGATGNTYKFKEMTLVMKLVLLMEATLRNTATYLGIEQQLIHLVTITKKVIYPGGPKTWKNTTNSTLGVWVRINNFFDTVAPIIDTAKPVEFVSPASWNVNSTTNTAQYIIFIPFSKELRLPHVKKSDFSITVTDARNKAGSEKNGTNDISDQISKYGDGTVITPTAVEVGNGTNFFK